MLTTLTILSLDQGKIYGETHPLFRPDNTAEVDTHRCADQIADMGGGCPKGLLPRHATSLAHFRDWLVTLVAVRRAL